MRDHLANERLVLGQRPHLSTQVVIDHLPALLHKSLIRSNANLDNQTQRDFQTDQNFNSIWDI